MSGLHLQRGVNDWTRTLTRYPRGIWIKTVDQVQMQDEAWRINNGLLTVLRHWYDPGQIFDTTNQGILRDRMQRFFSAFVDGTFNQIVKSAQPGQNVHAVEFWNEFYDPSNNQGTGAQFEYRVASEAAAAEVWANEYRDKPEYRHIRLVHANAAIGNNIPREVAQTCQTYDNLMGYHPYVPVNRNIGKATIPDSEVSFNIGTTSWNGSSNRPKYIPLSQSGYDHRVASFAPESNPNILPGEWPYLSGRWTVMDADWVRHGIRVKWLFTEFGPVGYGIDNGGNAWLKALDGWRHRDVCAGNVDEYLAVIDYWLQKTAAWNAANGSRALGAVLFTTGGVAPWHDFETRQPEIDAITAFMEAWGPVTPPEPPPPPPPQPAIRRYSRTAHLLPQNATEPQVLAVTGQAYSKRQTVLFSADDAAINPDPKQAALTGKALHVWGEWPGGSEQLFREWLNLYYTPLPSLTFHPWAELPGLFVFTHWPTRYKTGGLLGGGINQMFGANPDNYVQYGLPGHEGIDLHSVMGDPIYAAAPGVVHRVHTDPNATNYGINVRILHDGGYQTISAHLSAANVVEGQTVKAGDIIAFAGNSGNSSGPHLHLTLRLAGAKAAGLTQYPNDEIDPWPYMLHLL